MKMFSILTLILCLISTVLASEGTARMQPLFFNGHFNDLIRPLLADEDSDCLVRNLAYNYSKTLIKDHGEMNQVFQSLQLQNCDAKSPITQDPRMKQPEDQWTDDKNAIFVDINHGDDHNNDGSIEKPFKTIDYAINYSHLSDNDDKHYIYIREGDYYLEKSIKLYSLDSNLVLSAYHGEKVQLIGSKTIEVNWMEYKVNQFEIFKNKNIGYSIHSSTTKSPGQSIPGKMIYKNKTDTYEECQEKCQQDIECNAFLWNNNAVTGGWANMCYSIIDNENILVSEDNHVSGIKLNIYKADLSNMSIPSFTQLYSNNKRLINARYPNANPEYQGVHTDPSGYMNTDQAKWSSKRSFPAAFEYTIASPSLENSLYSKYSIGQNGPAIQWNPSTSYWALKNPVGGGGCTYSISTGMTVNEKFMSPRIYKNPFGGRIHAFHWGDWGNWMFDIDHYSYNNETKASTFGWTYGGFQEARGGDHGGKFFFENIFEELDSPDEWYYDAINKQLYLYPNGTINNYKTIQIPYTKRLLEIYGTSSSPVSNIEIIGLTFMNTDSTYMDTYEVPSGGDISVHRGGALFAQGTKGLKIEYNTFFNIGSNAICLSGYNVYSHIYMNEISLIGDSGILLLGDTKLVDATGNEHNEHIQIESNIIYNIGLYMKQSAPIMIARSSALIIHKNVLFNCPRAGININDGLGGGHRIFNNLIYNTVRETGDHGNINTWDRMPFVTLSKDGKTPNMIPQMNEIYSNYLIANYHSLWPIDHDDGSCYWHDYMNVLVYGGWKNYLGHSKSASNNFYIYPDSKVAESIKPFCAISHGATLNKSGWNESWNNNDCIIQSGTIYSISNCKDIDHIKELNMDTSYNTIYTNAKYENMKIHCESGNYYMNYTDYKNLGFDRYSTVKTIPSLSFIEKKIKELLTF